MSDQDAKRYYFDSVLDPSVIWVDLDKVDLSPGAKPMKLVISGHENLGGKVSTKFTAADPFKFLAP